MEVNIEKPDDDFSAAFMRAVELANRLADNDHESDVLDIADGILAGAVQYWMYSRQPCGDPQCEACEITSTGEGRVAEILRLVRFFAQESAYFTSPTDGNVGHA